MHHIERSVLVPFTATQMFALVADVPAYPSFLPWCAAASAVTKDDDLVQATVSLAFAGVQSRFTTLNTHVAPHSIALQLIDGPFRTLHGTWQFSPLGSAGCKVELDLHYQFSSGLLGRLIAPVFGRIAASLVDSFVSRAEAIYGPA